MNTTTSQIPADAHADRPADAGEPPTTIEDRSPEPSDLDLSGSMRDGPMRDGPVPDRHPERPPERGAEAAGRPGFLSGLMALLRPKVPALLREDLAEALLNGAGDGVFSPEERAMLNNILRLKEVRVEDVMVPRSEIDAIEITATLGELMREFEDSGHSRMPVYGDNLDDPKGMVHIRDVVAHITQSAEPLPVEADDGGPTLRGALDLRRIDLSRKIFELDLVRKVLFVPPSMLATNLMAKMQATRTQMALVIDEYGGTDGLVSLEDIIEMVVGNIEDEHDDEEVMIVERGDGVYLADARAELHEVKAVVGPDFDVAPFEDEADTIGGLIFTELGRVPAEGEVVGAMQGFEFHILDSDPRRVRRVKIVRLRPGDKRRRILNGSSEPI